MVKSCVVTSAQPARATLSSWHIALMLNSSQLASMNLYDCLVLLEPCFTTWQSPLVTDSHAIPVHETLVAPVVAAGITRGAFLIDCLVRWSGVGLAVSAGRILSSSLSFTTLTSRIALSRPPIRSTRRHWRRTCGSGVHHGRTDPDLERNEAAETPNKSDLK